MNALDVNEALNDLKDRYPAEIGLVESVQNLFNKEVAVISDKSRRALKSFPMQFTKRIPTPDGEWTTQLHIWADCQVPELLSVDPLVLTARNSDGESVLMSLLMAATGRFTQQVNYDLIQKILDTDMQFQYLTEPNDESSVQTGNVWDEEDLDHKTALDFLAEFAKGDGIFAGTGGDDVVKKMLEDFADRPEPEDAPGEPLSDPDFDESAAIDAIASSESQLQDTLATDAESIPTADSDTIKNEADPDQESATGTQEASPLNNPDDAPIAGSKKLLEALVTIGKNTIDFS